MSLQPAQERPLPRCPVGPFCLGGVSDTPEGLLDGSASGPGTQRALGPRQQLVVDLYGCTVCHPAILPASYVHPFWPPHTALGEGSPARKAASWGGPNPPELVPGGAGSPPAGTACQAPGCLRDSGGGRSGRSLGTVTRYQGS